MYQQGLASTVEIMDAHEEWTILINSYKIDISL